MLTITDEYPGSDDTFNLHLSVACDGGRGVVGWLIHTPEGLFRWRMSSFKCGGPPYSSRDAFLAGASEPTSKEEALAAMYAVYRLTAKA